VLRQQAQTGLRSRHPRQGETIDLILDDAQNAPRGSTMDAVATMQDPTTDPSIRSHPEVGAILVARDHGLPCGRRRYSHQAHGPAVGRPFRKTHAWTAPWSQEGQAPPGVKVVVLVAASALGPTVVRAGRAQRCHVASTRERPRRLCTQGWTRTAGRYGRQGLRRRRTAPFALATP
jgi:hypothetical protein